MSTTERNKATVRDLIDGLFTKGDLGAADTYLAEDFINHDPPFGVTPDREGMRAAAVLMREGFPDWHSEVHELVAEGDIVVERFTASGTQRGEVMGIPPTGKTVSLPGINIFRLRLDPAARRAVVSVPAHCAGTRPGSLRQGGRRQPPRTGDGLAHRVRITRMMRRRSQTLRVPSG
jgi:predicted ester cyclase